MGNEKISNENNELNAKLEEVRQEMKDLKNGMDAEKARNDGLSEKNKDLKKEVKRLMIDLGKLKELLRRACDLEAQMKNVLGDSEDIVVKFECGSVKVIGG